MRPTTDWMLTLGARTGSNEQCATLLSLRRLQIIATDGATYAPTITPTKVRIYV